MMNTLEEKAFNAAQQGNLEALQSLARKEARRGGNILNTSDGGKRSLLIIAASSDHERIIEWLLSDDGGRALGFTKVLAGNQFGDTSLHSAILARSLPCCRAIVEGCKEENGEREQMLNAMTSRGSSVLHLAAWNRRDDIVGWLLSNEEGGGRALGLKSETITALDEFSESALHSAAHVGHGTCVEALLSGCTAGERIKLFLAVDNEHGWSPLHRAARQHKAEAIVELLRWEESRMIVNARDHRGMTALHRLACDGGLDEENRREWRVSNPFRPAYLMEDSVRALLGLDLAATRARAAFVDVNAGLEIPEEIKIAAAAEEEAKKRAASETEENNVKRSRK